MPRILSNVKFIKILGKDLKTFQSNNQNLSFTSVKKAERYVLSDAEWIYLLNLIDRVNENDWNYEVCNNLPSFNFTIDGYEYYGIEIYENEIHIIKYGNNISKEKEFVIREEQFLKLKEILDKYSE